VAQRREIEEVIAEQSADPERIGLPGDPRLRLAAVALAGIGGEADRRADGEAHR
jgi:hypothetical protein